MSLPTPVRLRTAVAATALAASLVAAPSPLSPAASAASGFERGPDPTSTSIEATRGTFAVSQYSVSDLASRGFGSGTVYYPTSTTQGRFGVVAIAPGYTASESTIAWLGPRLASFGFVVITFNTNSRYDQPGSRGDQLLAALDHVIADSRTASRVDASRQAVVGHSMGGGGTLEAAAGPAHPGGRGRPDPVEHRQDLARGRGRGAGDRRRGRHRRPRLARTPCRSTTAPPAAERRAYLELAGASHFAPNTSNTTIAKYTHVVAQALRRRRPALRAVPQPRPAA